MSHYFITGATGAIGSALVPVLLAAGHDVSLLIRGADDAEVSGRLRALFDFWALDWGDERMRQRVCALRGDASSPAFGMDPELYSSLSMKANRIVHCAGAVRMNLPLEDARRSAVGSVQQIFLLAKAMRQNGRLEKIDVVSTVGVGGRLMQVPEEWLTVPRTFHNTYEQAKAEAEDVVRAELESGGLKVTLHRPSMVVGDSRSGKIIHFQIFYHLCEFLSGRRTGGLSPPLEGGRVDVVPVDHVAQMIAWSSEQPELGGRILHQCAGVGGSVSLKSLQGLIRAEMKKRGLRVPVVINMPSTWFLRTLKLIAVFLDRKSKRAVATLPVFLDYLASEQRFENSMTRQLVPKEVAWADPAWPDYLPRVVAAYLDAQYGKAKSH